MTNFETGRTDEALVEAAVAKLPYMYQPIYGHPELSNPASRSCEDRLVYILAVHDALTTALKRPLRVLDLGCAQGFFCHHLASRGARVHGIDFLQESIDVCKALAYERGDKVSIFENRNVDEFLPSIQKGEYDLVLGLSVFHHLIHENGIERVRELLFNLGRVTLACLFELALSEEPLYWGPSQPTSASEQLDDFAFVHEIGRVGTHLSPIRRPLFFASNSFWYLGGRAGRFVKWTSVSNEVAGNFYEGTRRFFFGEGLLIKHFQLDHLRWGKHNNEELQRESEFLRSAPDDLVVPKIVEAGENSVEAWLIRECLPGDTLDRKMAMLSVDYDPHQVVRDVLLQLVRLEKYGFFHSDIRTWNVLIEAGRAAIIDYGAITRTPSDVTWPHDVVLAFLIFVQEVSCGETFDPLQRPPLLDPDTLPEPYRHAVWEMLRMPKHEWSFAQLAKNLESRRETAGEWTRPAGVPALIQALQSKVYEGQANISALLETNRVLRSEVANKDDRILKCEEEMPHLRKRLEDSASREALLVQELERQFRLVKDISDSNKCIAEEQAHVAALEQYLQEIYASASWRVTAPLRMVGRGARWLGRGSKAWLTLMPGSRPRRLIRYLNNHWK